MSRRERDREGALLLLWHEALLRAAGPRHWWPGRSRLEIILGAILTQHTAWTNAAAAISALRSAGLLRWAILRTAAAETILDCIRPAGTYRQKTRTILAFVAMVEARYGGSLVRMARDPTDRVRGALLATTGIGPETADSILLYALGRPLFVIDAYALRVLARHGLLPAGTRYAEAQAWMAARLPADALLLNEFHAQFVWVGQRYCRTRPRCDGCPLEPFLPAGGRLPPEARPSRRTARRAISQPQPRRSVAGARGATDDAR